MRIIFFFILLAITVTSCDTIVSWNYRIKNNTKNPIKIAISYYDYGKNGKFLIENIIKIDPGQLDTVYMETALGGRVNDFEKFETITGFNEIRIFMNDSALINENFKLRNKWEYQRVSSSTANYNLVVN